jgi:hypothetical protein
MERHVTSLDPQVPPASQWNTGRKHGYMAAAIFDMAESVTELGLWEWFRTVKPKRGEGFMFMSDDNILRITKHPYFERNVGHSGMSCAWTMRQIQCIAINGFEMWDTV